MFVSSRIPNAGAKLSLGEELAEDHVKLMAKLRMKAGTFKRYFGDYAMGIDKGVIRAYVCALGKGPAMMEWFLAS